MSLNLVTSLQNAAAYSSCQCALYTLHFCSYVDTIREVVMSVKADVCEVHVLWEGSVLEKWVLKEMSTAYQVGVM